MNLGHLSPQVQVNNIQAEADRELQKEVEFVMSRVQDNGGSFTYVRGEMFSHLALNPQIMEIIKDLGYDVAFRARQVTKLKGLIFDSESVIEEQVTISNPLMKTKGEIDEVAKERVKTVMREKMASG